jgi:MFS family permease
LFGLYTKIKEVLVTSATPPKTSTFALGWKMFSSLKSPAFRIYFFATLAQSAAMSMQNVSSPYLIFHLTNSSALLGTMSLVGAVPMIIFSMFGGAFADRVRKKSLLIWGLSSMALISLLIAIALATGMLNREDTSSWWILIASSVIQGVLMGMMMPAIQAIIPELVSRTELMNAIAINTLGMTILNLLAPLAAGYIIGDNANYETVYYVVAGCYVVSLFFVFFIPRQETIKAVSTNIIHDISEGFKYIIRNSVIFRIIIFTLIIVVLSMPFQQLMPLFTDNILKVGPPGMGLLMSIMGVGSLIGSIFLAIMPGKKRGVMLLLSGILAGVSLTIFSFSAMMSVSLVVIFFLGVTQTFRNTIGGALLQSKTDSAYMGRVMSIMNMQWGIMSVCTFVAGVMAEKVPVQWVLGSLSILLVVLSVVSLGIFKNVRRVE